MTIAAEFEEKEFEAGLYREIQSSQALLWTPGQVLEGMLGFDAATTANDRFWEILGIAPTPGVNLARLQPRVSARFPEFHSNATLPDFSLNVFIQAKRSTRYERRPSDVVEAGLGDPSWFCRLDAAQQVLLEQLAKLLGRAALVVYAAPAFDTKAELFDHMKAGTVASNSSFPRALLLAGHSRWVYDSGGGAGLARSTPKRVGVETLDTMVAELAGRRARRVSVAPDAIREHSQHLRRSVTRAVFEVRSLATDRVRAIVSRVRSARGDVDDLESPAIVAAETAGMLDWFGVSWLCVGGRQTG